MKKLKKLTLTELANKGTVDRVLSSQNLNELKGGLYIGGPASGGFGVVIHF